MKAMKTFLVGFIVIVTSPIWIGPFLLFIFCSEIYDVGRNVTIKWQRWRGVPTEKEKEWAKKCELMESLGPMVYPKKKNKKI